MTGLESDQILGGMQITVPSLEFDSTVATAGGSDGGNAGELAAIPSFFYVNRLSDRFRLGFSVTAPMGGGVDYGDNYVGRYATENVFLSAISLSPSVGYRINERFSLGAGVSIIYTLFNRI